VKQPPVAAARLSYVNVFARDHIVLMRFYAALLGFAEVAQWSSPIFGCLDAGGVILGFHADKAYDLLDVVDRKPTRPTVNVYATFELPDVAAVDRTVERAIELGAQLVKAQYRTYYHSYQAVLADPEGNVFRLNHELGDQPR
jgi:predicted enzyme related to lactoylglutathione lyase